MPDNDYGVYQDGTNPVQWVVTVSPLTLSTDTEQAARYGEQDAMNTATYLNSTTDSTYFVGHVPKPH